MPRIAGLFYRSLFAAAFAGGLSVAGQAFAAPVGLPDFQPNCDMGSLNLTPVQRVQLRDLRARHQNAQAKALKAAAKSAKSRRATLVKLLSADIFDGSQAMRYINEQQGETAPLAMEELHIQYRLFQVLDAHQREMWLDRCLK